MVLPWLLVAMAIVTAAVCAGAHHARRLMGRSHGGALKPV